MRNFRIAVYVSTTLAMTSLWLWFGDLIGIGLISLVGVSADQSLAHLKHTIQSYTVLMGFLAIIVAGFNAAYFLITRYAGLAKHPVLQILLGFAAPIALFACVLIVLYAFALIGEQKISEMLGYEIGFGALWIAALTGLSIYTGFKKNT